MALTKYTQADFAALERAEDGYINLPVGDWSGVDFGGADRLHIAAGSILGNKCKLGDGCVLGDRCRLGHWCILGDGCELGNNCVLGDRCTLGYRCMLGRWCRLGDECTLGYECTIEGDSVHNATYFKVSNMGSRDDIAYCYCDTRTGEIYVRTGCWFSGIDDFVKRVHKVHAGTQHEVDYLAMVEFARARFARYRRTTDGNNG